MASLPERAFHILQHFGLELLPAKPGAAVFTHYGAQEFVALMKATGWQKHSVRGFLAGVVRKRLKLKLDSTIVEGARVYRVIDDVGQGAAKAPAQRRNT